jgi:glucose/arabinose dehydrogenase
MKRLSGFLASLVFLSCNTGSPNGSNSNTGSSDTAGNLPPVETRSANTNYEPAFPGQTRIGGVKTESPWAFSVVTNQLDNPWGIGVLPDGRLLITEKRGRMRIVTTEGAVGESISGVPAVNSGGQGGLLGLAIDPDFNNNRMVYWSFSENNSGGTLTAVAKGKLSADEKSFENVQVIYRATPAYNGRLHYGSRIVIDRNGYLYVSTGERSDRETRPQAQDLNSALGKIVRITKDGQPAPGNPFIGRNNARPEIYSYGHRNVQGLAFHPVTGDLWENEFGPRGGDELNRIEAGKNYGWPDITYGIEYSGGRISGGATQKNGMEQPVYYWDPVLSPSGMCFYRGTGVPEWENNLFITGLNSNHIARLVIRNNKVVGEERLLESEGQRFRDIIQGNDRGALYAVTDEGRLYRIVGR